MSKIKVINTNGIVQNLVDFEGKTIDLCVLYSRLHKIINTEIQNETIKEEAKNLLMSIYFPILANNNNKRR